MIGKSIEQTITQPTTAHWPRALLVAADLRHVRWAAARYASGATSHTLSNHVQTIQGALQLVDARLAQGQVNDVDALLDLAEQRMRESRVLMTRARRNRFANREPIAPNY